MDQPELGTVIPESGGVRKLQWRSRGRGKHGGFRLIYFVRHDQGVIWLLTMYPKNVQDNISAKVLQRIRKEIENG